MSILPAIAPSYYIVLMIPFFAYAIALLGFNLLFGYGGLFSFGHAMFLGFGAYGAAIMTGILGVKPFEFILFSVVLVATVMGRPRVCPCRPFPRTFLSITPP